MEALMIWWGQWGQLVLVALGVLAGLATWIARGEGKELARLVVQLLLGLSADGWDRVTEAQVKDIAGRVYDYARDYAGPPWLRLIPWRLFVTREMLQGWAWAGWGKAHAWYDSQLAQKAVDIAKITNSIPATATLR